VIEEIKAQWKDLVWAETACFVAITVGQISGKTNLRHWAQWESLVNAENCMLSMTLIHIHVNRRVVSETKTQLYTQKLYLDLFVMAIRGQKILFQH